MPGLTFRSGCIALLGIVIMAVAAEFFGVFAAGSGAFFGTEAIPLDALVTFTVFVLFGYGVFLATRLRLLQQAELLCIIYVLLIAAPLLTTGFWRFVLASSDTVVKEEDWEHYDALSPILWPHGPDLLGHRLDDQKNSAITTEGSVHWQTQKVTSGKSYPMPVLENSDATAISSISYQLPIMLGSTVALPLGVPYLITLRARGENLGVQSRYYVRLTFDDDPPYDAELFSSADGKNVTAFQPEGFNRHGLYGFTIPKWVHNRVIVQVGLSGPGQLAIADLNFYNVSALEGAYTGHRLVTREVYDQLPPALRSMLVVAPGSLFSRDAFNFLVGSAIPWREWSGPFLFWGGIVSMLLAITFALACLLRRQWIENERVSLPLSQVPITLAGLENQLREGISYLRNPYLWAGFIIIFFYSACDSLDFYFNWLPDLSISIPLKAYLPDPTWGHMWEINFTFSALYFGLALFMDLNVLLSFLIGFLLYRTQFWFGEAQGLTVDDKYPYGGDQTTGAILTYGLVILFVARRFLFGTVRDAWRGVKTPEVLSPRAAYLLILAAVAGLALLAYWAGLGVSGPLLLMLGVMLALVVAMKLRAESGYTSAGFLSDGGQPLVFLFTLFGSISFFNNGTAIFWGLFTMMFLSSSCFVLIPGLQVELVALGHRLKVRRGDIIKSTVAGVAGGLIIGGWAYFSGAYAIGANNFPIIGHYKSLGGLTFLTDALSSGTDASTAGASTWDLWHDGHHLGFLFGAGVTAALSFLRTLYAGFWFHPFGFMLGTSQMMQDSWGSMLIAWAVRLAVLRIGGAVSVRERLFPFAVGCVLAVMAVSFLVATMHGYAYFFHPGGPKPSDRY